MKEGWKYVSLGDVCSYRKNNGIYQDLPYIGLEHIEQGTGKLLATINSNDVKSNTFRFQKGDVLYGRLRPYLQKCIVAEFEGCCSTEIFPITSNVVNNHYLKFWLLSSKTTDAINKTSAGCRMPRGNMNEVLKFTFPLPPLLEQQRIVEHLDSAFAKIDALKANAEKMVEEAKTLFASALREAMTPKEGWEEKLIGEVFKSYSGGTPIKSHKEYYEGGNIPWLRSGEVCQQYITETEMFITDEGLKNSSAKYYPVDTVVIAMYGATAAQVGILKIEATSNQAVCGLLPNKYYIPEYVYFWFVSIKDKLAAQAQGGAQPNISQEKIKKVTIPFPPLPDQQRIVAHLDDLSAKVRQLEANFKKVSEECDALKQSILRETFE